MLDQVIIMDTVSANKKMPEILKFMELQHQFLSYQLLE